MLINYFIYFLKASIILQVKVVPNDSLKDKGPEGSSLALIWKYSIFVPEIKQSVLYSKFTLKLLCNEGCCYGNQKSFLGPI